jgi:hypothetical protein
MSTLGKNAYCNFDCRTELDKYTTNLKKLEFLMC